MVLPDVSTLLVLAHNGQSRLEAAVATLTATEMAAPSALSGWTWGHVLTHLARNADALVNLLDWARTGVRTPMYASPEQRNADIAAGACRGPHEQLDDLGKSAWRFAAAAILPVDRWAARVRTAQGRDIPASEVPWMRVREVWIHLIDLRVGVGVDALPDDLSAVLVSDVARWMSDKVDDAVELRPDGHEPVLLGPGQATPQAMIGGPANRIACWLVGRGGLAGLRVSGEAPVLPAWL